MSDLVSDLAARSGITPEQAQKGLGAVLSFLKDSVPQQDFDRVKDAVPNSDQAMAAAGANEQGSGGALGAIAGVAGKLFGGGGAAALLAKLSSLGVTPEKVQAFLARVMEFLRSHLPADTLKQIAGLFPGAAEKPG